MKRKKPEGSGPDLSTRGADKFEPIFIHHLPADIYLGKNSS